MLESDVTASLNFFAKHCHPIDEKLVAQAQAEKGDEIVAELRKLAEDQTDGKNLSEEKDPDPDDDVDSDSSDDSESEETVDGRFLFHIQKQVYVLCLLSFVYTVTWCLSVREVLALRVWDFESLRF